ncbi:hypothetical protein CEK26_009377 [Fusarium fujikuroi]|uniref:Uncharacterized protein n=1 Tax=Fusarium fujikuroi TaxID=5127 RepID=A0A5Q3DGG3_FUSFU|nr:uncharacterized protein Y057_13847 [Fusarium fujikuroi]QGI65427.1 hypothetical protein CEK27_009398 [Fusarium fujikuroi]QGI82676.1 hypothetical protein CEK25_009405 [Fusarium fujikuroi]QGI96308.1 hypothetical protein CEK26_009377 [Fusarium fujikuroi]VTT69113.1 unnamed protein product [Fusarium fujikuroi]
MSTSVKDLLLIPSDAMTLHGKILGVDATATTYLLNCPPDAESCERNGQTITLGPWAEKTLASSVDPTGTMDVVITEPQDGTKWFYSIHCEMSRSVAQDCTMINRPADGPSTIGPKTYRGESDLRELYGPTFEYGRVTLTEGLEKLKSEYPSTTTAEGTESVSKETGSSAAGADAPAESNGGLKGVKLSLATICAGLFATMVLSL